VQPLPVAFVNKVYTQVLRRVVGSMCSARDWRNSQSFEAAAPAVSGRSRIRQGPLSHDPLGGNGNTHPIPCGALIGMVARAMPAPVAAKTGGIT
jgi:hypothetical protein